MTDEQIIEKLGLTNVDDASREALVGQVRAVTEMRLMGLVTELLNDEQLQKFDTLREAGNSEAIWDWLNAELTNIDELREGVLNDYLTERAARN